MNFYIGKSHTVPICCANTNVQTFDVENNIFTENAEEVLATLYHRSTQLRKV